MKYLEPFLDYCRFARNLTDATIDNYKTMCRLFSDYLVSVNLSDAQATQETVVGFMSAERRKGSAASSINQYLVAVTVYYDFCVRFHFDEYKQNPVAGVKRMKVEKSLPVCVPAYKMQSIIDGIGETTFKEIRTKAILLLGYHCGLRRREITDLQDVDVDFGSLTIRVTGKGRKVRLVPMSKQLAGVLKRYLELRHVFSPFGSERFFITVFQTPLSYEQVAYIVETALAKHLPAAYCHCHILRHSFATACINAGVTLENLATLMGHGSVNTTMRYLSISATRIRQQIANVFDNV